MLLHLFFLPLTSATTRECPFGYDRLSAGIQCYTSSFCNELSTGFECTENVCCKPRKGTCTNDEVSVNGACYFRVGSNEPCSFTEQCRVDGQECSAGFCRSVADIGGVCSDPSMVVERLPGSNRVPDCSREPCSPGFNCEYSANARRFQCCGLYHREVDNNYGIVRMFPGTEIPFVCELIHNCSFEDTPYCVWSDRYKCNVCCSTTNC